MRISMLAVAALVALAGCSSADSTDSSTSTTSTSSAAMMDHSAKTIDVSLEGNQFVNASITIYEGDSVLWTHNDGMVGHSVTAEDGSFDTHENCVLGALPGPICMAEGETFKQTFKAAGSVEYYCRAHEGMTGTIEVIPHTMM